MSHPEEYKNTDQAHQPSRTDGWLKLLTFMDDECLPGPQYVSFGKGGHLGVQLVCTADFDEWAKQLDASVWSRDERHENTVQCHASAVRWHGWDLFLSVCMTYEETAPKLTREEDDLLRESLGSAYYNVPDPAAFMAGMRAKAALTPDSPELPAADDRGPHAIAIPSVIEEMAAEPKCDRKGCGHFVRHHDDVHGCMCGCDQTFPVADHGPHAIADEPKPKPEHYEVSGHSNGHTGYRRLDCACNTSIDGYSSAEVRREFDAHLAAASPPVRAVDTLSDERVEEILAALAANVNTNSDNAYIRALPELGSELHVDDDGEIWGFRLSDGRWIEFVNKWQVRS